MSNMATRITDREYSHRDRDALKVLAGGVLGMVVAMGIGRFAYTPILPLMLRDLEMTNTLGGWLAGLNYLGYLIGAVACTINPRILSSRNIAGGALLLSLATTIFMGATVSQFWWGIMRLCGGISSAILFIMISAQVAEALVRRGYGHWMGALYGGIGLGIAMSGLIVPQLDKAGGWNFAWIGMGIIAIIFALMGITLGWKSVQTKVCTSGLPKPSAELGRIRILAAAYFLEGLGYIVTATFIVTVISMTPGLETLAPYSWVAVGLSAIPSTIIWTHLARRMGNRKTLLAAYALQAAGILVSVQAATTAQVLFAAVTFGGTFLGIVAVTLAEGKSRMGSEGGLSAAFLTASFSVGQMLGPVIAGKLADWQDGFALPLLLAAISVILGGVLIAVDRNFSTQKP